MAHAAFEHHGIDDLVSALSAEVSARQLSIATAESLTGGQLASALSAAPDATQWYCGGIVAYRPEVKYTVLNTPRGPVVTADTAREMARSIVTLMGADLSVALTGVGGPDSDEGEPAGTVFLATCAVGKEPIAQHHLFAGGPLAVMEHSIEAALRALLVQVTWH